MNLKQTVLLIAVVVVGVLFLLAFSNYNINHPVLNNSTKKVQNPIIEKWESKIDDQANITVTVTPSNLSFDSKEWKFSVVMDTHSVELDQDLVKLALLIDDKGKEYKPLRWEGAPIGGHHREGVLIFNQITPTPKSIELKISGIGGVVRSFKWDIK